MNRYHVGAAAILVTLLGGCVSREEPVSEIGRAHV